jgi:hypothetical protein
MIIPIDPGINGTGWALFHNDKDKLHPEKTGVIRTPAHLSWQERHDLILEAMDQIILDNGLDIGSDGSDVAYIELPKLFETPKGMACATGRDGQDSDLVKLGILLGRLQQLFFMYDIKVVLVRVNDWKGTLPKPIVALRIASRLKIPARTYANHNECDAVGIGLWAKGVFKANAVNTDRQNPKGQSRKNNSRSVKVNDTRPRTNNKR